MFGAGSPRSPGHDGDDENSLHNPLHDNPFGANRHGDHSVSFQNSPASGLIPAHPAHHRSRIRAHLNREAAEAQGADRRARDAADEQRVLISCPVVPDVNEEKICYFKFEPDYSDLKFDDKGDSLENPQDDFMETLPPMPNIRQASHPPTSSPSSGREDASWWSKFCSRNGNQEEQEEDTERILEEPPAAESAAAASELGADELNPFFRSKGSRMDDTMLEEEADLKEIRRHLMRPRYGLPVGKLPFGTPNVVDMEGFTSLNYPTSSCEYKTEHDERLLRDGKPVSPPYWGKFLVALFIGIIVGFLGSVLNFLIDLAAGPKYIFMSDRMERMGRSPQEALQGIAILCGINMLLCGLSTFLGHVEPVSTGSGIPHIKSYLNGVKVQNLMHFRTLICKFLGVILSVCGGMPVGKEGPMIHSGAIVGAGLSQGKATTTIFKHFPGIASLDTFRNDVTKREFVAVGAAAGVAAAFGAPLGGILFVVEEGGSFLDVPMIGLTLVGAGASFLTLNILSTFVMGNFGDLSSKGLLSFGSFDDSTISYNMIDLFIFAIVGLGSGLLGSLFNHINEKWTRVRLQYFKSAWKRHLEVLVVSLVVTMAAIACMFLVDDCKNLGPEENEHLVKLYCKDGQYHSGAAIWFATPESIIKDMLHAPHLTYTFKTLIVFSIVYFMLAVVTYGLPISSGLFIPCLLIGSSVGRLVGMLLKIFMPSFKWGDLGVYALVGACAMLTGVVRIAICICAILTEATGNHLYAFPILMVAVVAKLAADRFNEGIYEIHNDLSGVAYLHWTHAKGSEILLAKSIMTFPVHCFERFECVRNVYHFILNYPHHGIPIVEHRNSWTSPEATTNDGKLIGIVLKEDVLTMLKLRMYRFYEGMHRENDRPLPDLSKRKWSDFRRAYPHYFRPGDIEVDPDIRDRTFMDFTKIMDPNPNTAGMNGTLSNIFENFRSCGLRHLIVVNERRQVKGIITRKDIYSYMCHQPAKLFGSQRHHMGKKTQVVKAKNFWIVVRRY